MTSGGFDPRKCSGCACLIDKHTCYVEFTEYNRDTLDCCPLGIQYGTNIGKYVRELTSIFNLKLQENYHG